MTKLAALLTLLPALLAAQPDRFGLPHCAGPEAELADRLFFTLCHDSSLKVARWIAHEIRPAEAAAAHAENLARSFQPDAALHHPAARNADYRASGYSRGHLVPAEDFAWSAAAFRNTYLLSNVIPQVQSVNGGVWRRLESAVRHLAAASDSTYVVTGPIFDNPRINFIGDGQVAVPTHTFKVVLAFREGRPTMLAAIVPNAPVNGVPVSHFLTTVDEVERRTGLDFFSALDSVEQRRLESHACESAVACGPSDLATISAMSSTP